MLQMMQSSLATRLAKEMLMVSQSCICISCLPQGMCTRCISSQGWRITVSPMRDRTSKLSSWSHAKHWYIRHLSCTLQALLFNQHHVLMLTKALLLCRASCGLWSQALCPGGAGWRFSGACGGASHRAAY